MTLPLKVLWSEGQTLGPQQFQQMDRYHEARLQRMAAALRAHVWGVRSIEWMDEALASNRLCVQTMSLIFPDGEIYEAPNGDALPPPVDLSSLPQDQQSFTFYAALPALQPYGGNLGAANGATHEARYARVDSDTPDLYSEAVSTDVAFLRKTVRLRSQLESRDAHVSMPVIRLRRVAGGGFEQDPAFVPPCLAVGSSAALPRMLDTLLAKLNAKIASLYQRHRQPAKGVLEFHSGDMASYWMLNTLNTAAASLGHCARYRLHHPEELFDRMTALAGSLMTFSSKYAVAELPAYSHDDAGPAFARLDAIIRELADVVISSKYFTIPLVLDPDRTTHLRGMLDAAQVDSQTMLGIAASADMPPLELVAALPVRLKIGTPDDVDRMINTAVSGVKLLHMAQVPPEVPVRPNTFYFSLERKSALYEAMLKAQAITIFAPEGMKGLKLELFALKA
ncbi:type VI secretion system baseplate subunit TssK [Pseudoduganella namucuonensis]|uniref:Type VI secretion system protein ImpJ n=1 Tax=Pseudoduganella namucuonensis TaxID=1035707 RepID=A0A1I7JXC3_9BURK|nr:type VI secretion system baseplate subunit TssK [Pseudoduganella namucuonensis]SFU89847.1 type VI secretion system protein ImpJ [Pseudoduganella namucuonensis]